ncbi:MAG: hypothetical protein ACOX8Q_09155 [Christensenellales bacterium]|jgi:hypothetical protein
MKRKDIIMIVLAIAIPAAAVIGYIAYIRINYQVWPKTVEHFYNENKQVLNEFVEMCDDNDISYISYSDDHANDADICTLVNGYYVYTYKELSDSTVKELSGLFNLFKKYKVHNIYVSNDYFAGILFGMGGFGYSISLKYLKEIKTIEEIKKASFYSEVWYIDDHWFIGYGD